MASPLLEDMRNAWAELAAETAGERQAEAWLRRDQKGFTNHMAVLERQAGGDVTAEWDGKGNCPCCGRGVEAMDEGSEAALKVLDQWLKDEGL